MAAAGEVFEVPELLEMIIVNLPASDILSNAQIVSKAWYSVTKGCPTIQRILFQRESDNSFDNARYTKNMLLASMFSDFFNMVWSSDVDDSMKHGSTYIDLSELDYAMDLDFRPLWLAANASWRTMHIAQPSITKVHWQVHRDCGTKGAEGWKELPAVVAEFDFPDGLRMGDYYDLIVATRGCRSDNDQLAAADRDRALLVKQVIYKEDRFAPSGAREDWWRPVDLTEKYHANLTKLEKREWVHGAIVPFNYVELEAQTPSAMNQFLQAATTLAKTQSTRRLF
ncbi:hypothetical protein Hte_008111 [Hypoxylon texense]